MRINKKLFTHLKRKVLKRKNVSKRSKLFSETYFSPDISFTHNRDLKIQRRGQQRKRQKNNWFN